MYGAGEICANEMLRHCVRPMAVYGGGEGAAQLGSNGWYTAKWRRQRLLGLLPYYVHERGSMHTRRPRCLRGSVHSPPPVHARPSRLPHESHPHHALILPRPDA